MELLLFLIVFSAGLAMGLAVPPLARMVESEGINKVLEVIGGVLAAPFVSAAGFFRRLRERHRTTDAMTKGMDAREQQINDSVRQLRGIVSSLASVIQKTDRATNDSSQTLAGVKRGVEDRRGRKPTDLTDAHSQLLAEIDQVIASNTVLKDELASSQVKLEDQKRQIEELKTAVRIDGLTQLANRTYFDEKLSEMINLRERYHERFSLMMIDIDNFKEINDRYGHLAGDRILKGVAFTIKSDLRESDFLARFGGDEFAVLIIKADRKIATDIAWKICTDIRQTRFVHDEQEFKVTISIGVAEALPGEKGESLIRRADAALYHVKQHGRDGVDTDEAAG